VYHAHLLMRSYREGGKVRKESLANLTPLGDDIVALIRAALKGKQVRVIEDTFGTRESRPHGQVLAVLTAMRRLGLERLLASRPSRQRSLALALIAKQLLAPSSKLATSRSWTHSTLASELGVQGASEDELYAAMDWLVVRQRRIKAKLAKRHLKDGELVLYDVTSSYVEGDHCELAAFGHNRDKKKGKRQVTWGLMTDGEGRPVAVEAFMGNTSDVSTLLSQVRKAKDRFGLSEFVLIGDRGMISGRHIDAFRAAAESAGAADDAEDLSGVTWVTAVKSAGIRALVSDGTLQPSLFEKTNLLSFTHPAYPGERLIACYNPLMAAELARKREELLSATLEDLQGIEGSVKKGRLKDATKIALRAGKVIGKHKMQKHIKLSIDQASFAFEVNHESVAAEKALDGIYILRTSAPEDKLADAQVVLAYKDLPKVERAFRTLKSVAAQVRPIRHRLSDRVRAHLLLCMLAYYVRWHMERAWASLTFKDEDPETERDPIAPAKRSPEAQRKAHYKTLENGEPTDSFDTLLASLQTIVRNTHYLPEAPDATFTTTTEPNTRQRRALDLLDTITV